MAMSTVTPRAIATESVWCAPESEAAPYFSLRAVEQAYLACRKRKHGKVQTCLYESRLLDNLVDTSAALQAGSWQPSPPVVFCVQKPKAREVYAAQFHDRVVHHLLVPWLEQAIGPDFVYDAAANRKGKGTHFAVQRLQHFMRQRLGQGFFLQLDIASFFTSIHHQVLLDMLAVKLQKAVKRGRMPLRQARQAFVLSRRICTQNLAEQAMPIGPPWQFIQVPVHKRLSAAPPATGLPIGNLTSQFFASLYLNELDQFVKHQLKCRCYVRYVDDFILLHDNKAQLQRWHQQIGAFLQQRLRLALNPRFQLAPLKQGADFLGYIVKPSCRLVRRRVLGNLYEKLQALQRLMVQSQSDGIWLDIDATNRERLRATLASYWGHFSHASAFRLREALFRRYCWLHWLFVDAQFLLPRWQPAIVSSFIGQCRYFIRQYHGFSCLVQKGNQWLCFDAAGELVITLRHTAREAYCAGLRRQYQRYAVITEQGFLKGGMKRRVLQSLWWPEPDSDGGRCHVLVPASPVATSLSE